MINLRPIKKAYRINHMYFWGQLVDRPSLCTENVPYCFGQLKTVVILRILMK